MIEDTTNWSEAEALLLGQAREGLGPTEAERTRALARISAGFVLIGATTPPALESQGGGGLDLPSAARTSGYSLITLIAAVLTSAAVGFGSGVYVTRTPRPEPAISSPAPRPVAVVEPVEGAARIDGEVIQDLASLVEGDAAPVTRSSAGIRSRSSARSDAAAAPTFYDELSHVRRAQAALKQGNAALALGLMQSLDEARPGGALLAERSVTKVLALCQLGREEEATQLARAVLSNNDDATVYRKRLASSCAKLDRTSMKE